MGADPIVSGTNVSSFVHFKILNVVLIKLMVLLFMLDTGALNFPGE